MGNAKESSPITTKKPQYDSTPYWERVSLDQLVMNLREEDNTSLIVIGLLRRLVSEVEQLRLDVDEARNVAGIAQVDAENALGRTGYYS